MGGSSFKSLRLFQLVSVCFYLFSVVTNWFSLFHVGPVILTSVGSFKLFELFCACR